MENIQKLLDNTLVQLFLAILAVVSTLLAIVFYFKSKKKMEIRYFIEHNVLISETDYRTKKLEILYQGKKIANLVQSRVTFVNTGNATLESSNIAKAEPLRISVANPHEILEVVEIKQSEPNNLFEVHGSSNDMNIIFDYFSPRDTVIITILHTDSSAKSFDIFGGIKGGKIIKSSMDDFEKVLTVWECLVDPATLLMELIKIMLKKKPWC